MSALDTPQAKLGLRERKKQQTREKISRVALELFDERGYDHTTLADIADAADVSPRTIFSYFEGKEDIIFCHEEVFLDALKPMLDARPEGTTTIDALRDFLSAIEQPTEEDRLRKKIITSTPALQMRMRAQSGQLEPVLAESIAKDLGAGEGDMRPHLIAASMTAAFMSVRDRFIEAEAGGDELSHEQGMAVLDQVLEFARGGLEALQQE